MWKLGFRAVGVMILALHPAGCVTWSPVTTPPVEFILTNRPEKILINGNLELRHPTVATDSISGLSRFDNPRQFAVAEVETVAVPVRDGGKTAKAVIGSVFLAGFVVALTTCESWFLGC